MSLVLGCALSTDLDGLAGGAGGPGSIDDSGVAERDGGGDERAGASDADSAARQIAFGSATTAEFAAASPPCTLVAPVIPSDSTAALLLAISINAGGEVLPSRATYNGVDLGAPLATDRVDYSRAAVWIVKSPSSAGQFSIAWSPQGIERGVMVAASYTGVDPANPYRTPAAHAVGSASPASVVVTSAQTNDWIVGFFALNDTSNADGFTPERVGSGQTYRLQQATPSNGSQIALSDSTASTAGAGHTWSYATAKGWAAVAVALKPAE